MAKKQEQRDRQRITYRLRFPSDVSPDSITAWLSAISGALRHPALSATPRKAIVFEVWSSSSSGFEWFIKVPVFDERYIISQLTSHISGAHYDPVPDIPRRLWTTVTEYGMTHHSHPLNIASVGTTASVFLASMQSLNAGETLMMQLVMSPASPKRPPIDGVPTERAMLSSRPADRDEVAERRAKLAEVNYKGVLRVASVSDTKPKALDLISRVRNALFSVQTPDVQFEALPGLPSGRQKRVDYASTPDRPAIQLSASELASLMAWPIGNPFIVGLPASIGRRMPPTEALPRQGIVIGHSTFPGSERPIAIGYQEALMHTHVIGKTGTGKSLTLAHMARQIMNDGYGLILIEAEGNLYESVLDIIPPHRADDVVLLDVSDTMHPVGFNIFDQGDPLTVIDQVIELFKHKYGDSGGVWLQEFMYFAMRTLTETPGLAFTDLATLLVPRTEEEIDFVDNITRNLKDEELRRWWQRQDNRDRKQQQQRSDPVMSRIWQIASRPELRHIMGQSKSSFNVSELMRDGKILLVNMKGVSSGASDLVGTLLMNSIWQAIKSTPKSIPTYVMMDEFGDYMDLPVGLESMFAQARKHNAGFIVANQNMTQLPASMRDAVVTNARNKIILQVNNDDARTLLRELSAEMNPIDLTNLPIYEAMAQIMTPAGSSRPVSIKTEPPMQATRMASEVIQKSRLKYARPLSEVKQEMSERIKVKREGGRGKPRISGLNNP